MAFAFSVPLRGVRPRAASAAVTRSFRVARLPAASRWRSPPSPVVAVLRARRVTGSSNTARWATTSSAIQLSDVRRWQAQPGPPSRAQRHRGERVLRLAPAGPPRPVGCGCGASAAAPRRATVARDGRPVARYFADDRRRETGIPLPWSCLRPAASRIRARIALRDGLPPRRRPAARAGHRPRPASAREGQRPPPCCGSAGSRWRCFRWRRRRSPSSTAIPHRVSSPTARGGSTSPTAPSSRCRFPPRRTRGAALADRAGSRIPHRRWVLRRTGRQREQGQVRSRRPPDRPAAGVRAVVRPGAAIDEATKAQALADLKFWNADVLVLPHTQNDRVLRETVQQLVGAPAKPVDGVWVWDVRALT